MVSLWRAVHVWNYTVDQKSHLPRFFESLTYSVAINPFFQGIVLNVDYLGGSNSCVENGSKWFIHSKCFLVYTYKY